MKKASILVLLLASTLLTPAAAQRGRGMGQNRAARELRRVGLQEQKQNQRQQQQQQRQRQIAREQQQRQQREQQQRQQREQQRQQQQPAPGNQAERPPQSPPARPAERPLDRPQNPPTRGADSAAGAPPQAAAGFQGPGHLGYWLGQNRSLSLDQQRQALQNDPQFRGLPADRQQHLMSRLEEFNRLPREQQERMLRNMEIMEHWTPEQRHRAQDLTRRARQLPENRREAVRRAIGFLNNQEPARRRQLLASPQFRQRFNEQEREIIVGALDLGVPPSRMNPREQQPPPEMPPEPEPIF